MGTASLNGVETLWCETGRHEWLRLRRRGGKPSRCPNHGGRTTPYANEPPIPCANARGDLYLAALTVALDDDDPAARDRAGLLMRDLADGMRSGAPIDHSSDSFPGLRAAICAALDHRIYGS